MASLRKINGRYYAYFYSREREPKRKSWPLDTSRQDVARRRLTEREEGFRNGNFDPWAGGWIRETSTLTEALSRFLRAKGETVRESTLEQYRIRLEAWKRDHTPAGLQLRDVSAGMCRSYIHDRSVSTSTRKGRARYLGVFFRWCIAAGLLDESPLDQVAPVRGGRKEKAYFRPEQIDRLLTTIQAHQEMRDGEPGTPADDRWLMHMIPVALATGLRRSELIRLRWDDVDLEGQTVTVRSERGAETKSGHDRRIPLRGRGLQALSDRLHATHLASPSDDEPRGGYVFTDRAGKPIKANRISQRVRFFVDQAKLKGADQLSFKSLRNSCATWLLADGVPLAIVSKILGHSSTRVTAEHYDGVDLDTIGDELGRAMDSAFSVGGQTDSA